MSYIDHVHYQEWKEDLRDVFLLFIDELEQLEPDKDTRDGDDHNVNRYKEWMAAAVDLDKHRY